VVPSVDIVQTRSTVSTYDSIDTKWHSPVYKHALVNILCRLFAPSRNPYLLNQLVATPVFYGGTQFKQQWNVLNRGLLNIMPMVFFCNCTHSVVLNGCISYEISTNNAVAESLGAETWGYPRFPYWRVLLGKLGFPMSTRIRTLFGKLSKDLPV
jgi:hypothetical protein